MNILTEDSNLHRLTFEANENTWSHQRKKRRIEQREKRVISNQNNELDANVENEILNNNKRKLEFEDNSIVKKVKEDSNSIQHDSFLDQKCLNNPILKCDLEIKNIRDSIYVQLSCIEAMSKDYANQILQFIRNKLRQKN